MKRGYDMTDIQIHVATSHQSTCVSNTFIDCFMPDASGEFVKIYLYLLRVLSSGDRHFNPSAMADKFHYTENDIRRGLSYWEQMHLLQLEYNDANQLTGICLLEPGQDEHKAPAPTESSATIKMMLLPSDRQDKSAADLNVHQPKTEEKALQIPPDEPRHYSPRQIAAFKKQDDVAELLYISERYVGHPLNLTEVEKILFWAEELHFPVDMIEYLVECCVEKGHPNFHYMNKVALNWKESGISSLQEAKDSTNIHSQSYYAIMKAFGISGRNLTERETAFINKWTSSYGFSLDIIREACERTIRNTGKVNFEYADSILGSWSKKGIRQLDDIARLDEAFAPTKQAKVASAPVARTKTNRFHNFEQRQYDDDYYEALEQQLLRK